MVLTTHMHFFLFTWSDIYPYGLFCCELLDFLGIDCRGSLFFSNTLKGWVTHLFVLLLGRTDFTVVLCTVDYQEMTEVFSCIESWIFSLK